MSDPTLFEDEIIVEDPMAEEGAMGEMEPCATCAHWQPSGEVPGQEPGWGECLRIQQPGALFEIEGGGVLWVEQGFHCNQYEPAGEEAPMVEVPVE